MNPYELVAVTQSVERIRVTAFIKGIRKRYGYEAENSPYERGFLEALAQIESELDSPTVKIEDIDADTGELKYELH